MSFSRFRGVFIALGLIVIVGCGNDTSDTLSAQKQSPAILSERPVQVTDEEKKEMITRDLELTQRFAGGFSTMLKDVSDGTASGVARIAFPNDTTEHFVHAEDLPVLDDNSFYEGWLVSDAQDGDFFSTGEMIFNQERQMWELDYSASGDQSDYAMVVITREPRDDDPAPAEHILEGTFLRDQDNQLQ